MIGALLIALVPLLAEAGGSSETITVGSIIGIIGAVGAAFAHKAGKASRLQIDPQPFIVKMQEEFVRRDEFRDFKTELKTDIGRLGALFEKVNDKVENKHIELLQTLELAAKTGRDGRVALWNDLQPLAREFAALKATSNVAEHLARLAQAIDKAHPPKPTRNHGTPDR